MGLIAKCDWCSYCSVEHVDWIANTLLVCGDGTVEHTGWTVVMPGVRPLRWMVTRLVLMARKSGLDTPMLHNNREHELVKRILHQHNRIV